MSARYIHKRREYRGQVRTVMGMKSTYGPWQVVGAFEQMPKAQNSIAAQPKVGLWKHAIFYRGKRLYDT